MRLVIIFSILLVLLFTAASFSQNRIHYNNQDLFLCGSNLAWINFANDVGTGNPDTASFIDALTAINSSGGNVVRWWLHTNGTVSPAFDTTTNYVIGPGTYTISDIRKVLDIAWSRNIGVILCLWSFDMLRLSNPSNVLTRNNLLLSDSNYTRAYVNNCLIPMVDSLKGHPAIIAWEIFNEPEGMSNEFGWSGIGHVSMSKIERCVNFCSAAIHRLDPAAKVTSGAWAFYSLVDAPILAKAAKSAQPLSYADQIQSAKILIQKNRLTVTPEEMVLHLQKIAAYATQKNYYSDSMLIFSGGDSLGTLDFYCVHFYGSGTSTSPFHHPPSYWNLTKPIVVAEFAMESSQGAPTGIPTAEIYDTLYQLGYAGAMAWSWSDSKFSTHTEILGDLLSMRTNHMSDIYINGISGAWPNVAITSPVSNSKITDTTAITITASASDIDGVVDSVEFFVNDTIKIGADHTSPFLVVWQNVPSGSYHLTAIATDNDGHRRTSIRVGVTVGTPPMVRLEAENATLSPRFASDMTIVNDVSASGGKYVDIKTSDSSYSITWTLNNVPAAGDYIVTFGYRLAYQSPKYQDIIVNGIPLGQVQFAGASISTWYEKDTVVSLVQDTNKIKMKLNWGWMQLDYLAVPKSFIPTLVKTPSAIPVSFALEQNFPNPFNPTTNIRYSLERSGLVKLVVYDILGRQIATLVNEKQNAGNYNVPFDARTLTSGVYFYRISAGSFIQSKKMVVIK